MAVPKSGKKLTRIEADRILSARVAELTAEARELEAQRDDYRQVVKKILAEPKFGLTKELRVELEADPVKLRAFVRRWNQRKPKQGTRQTL